MSLSMPFLKVPPLMQIGDVKQFLNLKFSFSKEDFDLLEVFITHQQNVRHSYPHAFCFPMLTPCRR